jgi:hypothetical protein
MVDKEIIRQLDNIESKSVTKMLNYIHGDISESELSLEDLTETLKLNENISLTIINTDSGIISWMHYDNEGNEFCIHPINNWDPHDVNLDKLREEINNPDSPIDIEVRHKDNTPLENGCNAKRDSN